MGVEVPVPIMIEKKCFFFTCQQRYTNYEKLCNGFYCMKKK